MSKNNKIGILLIACWIFTACQTTSTIPIAYNFKAKEVKNNPYGCWTTLVVKPEDQKLQPETISGELLFMDADTLFLLISDKNVWPVYSASILKAQLYTHRNMGGSYLTTTALFLIPNVVGALIHTGEYGGGFLVIGIPVAAFGLLHTIIEGSSKRNMLLYPEKNTLENLSQFARFPAGRPLNVDLHELKLKPTPVSP